MISSKASNNRPTAVPKSTLQSWQIKMCLNFRLKGIGLAFSIRCKLQHSLSYKSDTVSPDVS